MLEHFIAMNLIYIPLNSFISNHSPEIVLSTVKELGCNLVCVENTLHNIDEEGPPTDGKVKLVKLGKGYVAVIWKEDESCWMIPDGSQVFNKGTLQFYLIPPEDQIDQTGHYISHDELVHAEIPQKQ